MRRQKSEIKKETPQAICLRDFPTSRFRRKAIVSYLSVIVKDFLQTIRLLSVFGSRPKFTGRRAPAKIGGRGVVEYGQPPTVHSAVLGGVPPAWCARLPAKAALLRRRQRSAHSRVGTRRTSYLTEQPTVATANERGNQREWRPARASECNGCDYLIYRTLFPQTTAGSAEENDVQLRTRTGVRARQR